MARMRLRQAHAAWPTPPPSTPPAHSASSAMRANGQQHRVGPHCSTSGTSAARVDDVEGVWAAAHTHRSTELLSVQHGAASGQTRPQCTSSVGRGATSRRTGASASQHRTAVPSEREHARQRREGREGRAARAGRSTRSTCAAGRQGKAGSTRQDRRVAPGRERVAPQARRQCSRANDGYGWGVAEGAEEASAQVRAGQVAGAGTGQQRHSRHPSGGRRRRPRAASPGCIGGWAAVCSCCCIRVRVHGGCPRRHVGASHGLTTQMMLQPAHYQLPAQRAARVRTCSTYHSPATVGQSHHRDGGGSAAQWNGRPGM